MKGGIPIHFEACLSSVHSRTEQTKRNKGSNNLNPHTTTVAFANSVGKDQCDYPSQKLYSGQSSLKTTKCPLHFLHTKTL